MNPATARRIPSPLREEDAPLPDYSPEELVRKWEDFFEAFGYTGRILNLSDTYPEDRSLEVPFEELNRFDVDFAIHFLRRPQNSVVAAEEAVRRMAPPGDEPIHIHVRVKALPRDTRILVRDLRAEHLGRFVVVDGLVRKATEVRPKIVDASFECLRCHAVVKEAQEGTSFREPLECYEDQGGCGRSAASTKFKLLGEAATYLDTQKIEIQEPPEILRGGEEPQRLEAYMEDDIVGLITPGERVVLNGVLRSAQRGRPGARSTIFDIFLDVNSAEKERVEFEEIEITPADIVAIREEAAKEGVVDRVVESIAPAIFGMEMEKEALALQLFGGVPKVLPDGTRIRGDSHLLLVGDPGLAKSQLLSYMAQIAPRAIMVSGKGTSAAGLLAAAVKDEFGEGRWTLEAGALVLADRGLAVIDEIEKMNPQDRGSIHQAMEEQLIHIAKAGITATLPARCAVLAAANPQFGRFSKDKYISEQINLDPALLSVSGDAPLLIRRAGVVESTTMSELVDPWYEGRPESLPVEVCDLEVPSLSPHSLKVDWQPVSHVFRHAFPRRLLRLHLESGRSVTVTPGHSIYGFRDGRIAAVPCDRLQVGDFVAVPRGIPIRPGAPAEFLLPRHLMSLPESLRRGIFLHNVPRAAFTRLKDVPYHWSRAQKLPLERSPDLTDEELRQCVLRVSGGSGDAIPTIVPVDGRLMRFLGYFVAEGSALISSSRCHVISFALGPKDDHIVDDLRRICSEVFGYRVREFRSGTDRKVTISNKVVYLFLVHVLRVARGAWNKRAPEIVFNATRENQEEFIQAYWRGDAGVSVSGRMMSDLLYLFLFRRTVGSVHFDGKVRRSVLGGRTVTSRGHFQLVSPKLPGFESRGLYAYLPQHLMRPALQTLSGINFATTKWTASSPPTGRGRSITPRWWRRFRGRQVEGRIQRLSTFLRWTSQKGYEAIWGLRPGGGQAFLQTWLRRDLLERRPVHDGTTRYEYHLSDEAHAALADIKFVERFMGSDVTLVRLTRIEECDSSPFVYDLSVPGNENFVAGFGGVVCHNSRFDAIFPILDTPDPEKDRLMAEHILHGHRLGEEMRSREELGEAVAKGELAQPYTPYFSPEFLRKYVAFAKRIYPVMTPDAMNRIRDHYLDIRKEAGKSSVPITPRQLEAFVRLSEASARARLSPLVDVQDADRAVGIVEYWLRRVASVGGEGGPLDIDIVATGVPSTQRDQMIALREVIAELGGTEMGEGAGHQDILSIAEQRGVPRDRAEAWLRKWRSEGELYVPTEGRYKLVTRL